MGYKTGKTSVTLLVVIMMTLTLGVVTVYADEDPALQQVTRDEADFDLSSDAIEADGAAGDEVNNGTYKGIVNADGTVTVTGLVDYPADDPVYWGIIPSFIDGRAVTAIGDDAFGGVLSQLIIPDSVKTIGDRAFCGSDLVGPLKLPENLVSIGDSAFEGCGFAGDLTIPDGITSIGKFAFCGNTFSGDLTIPNTVSVIGDEAFNGCDGFNGTLTVPKSLKKSGVNAFPAYIRSTK